MNTNNINNDAKMSNADPQSKLVKDIMSRQIEQETIARGPKVNEVSDFIILFILSR